MTESDWVRYFSANGAEPTLPWNDGYRLSGAERAVVIESIQQFQLGENAQGRRLLQRAESLNNEFVQALRLFINEEKRHSQFLGRFLEMQGERCLRRHWVHAAFRRVRGFAGLELRMRWQRPKCSPFPTTPRCGTPPDRHCCGPYAPAS